MENGYKVDAYSVEGKVDYEDVVKRFGISLIDNALLEQIIENGEDVEDPGGYFIMKGVERVSSLPELNLSLSELNRSRSATLADAL